jgi:hypothetical protein
MISINEEQAVEAAELFAARAERHPFPAFQEVLRNRAAIMRRVAEYLRLEVAARSVNFDESAEIYWPLRCLGIHDDFCEHGEPVGNGCFACAADEAVAELRREAVAGGAF